MKKWYCLVPVVTVVAVACILTAARAQKQTSRAEFMRQKLDFSQGLLAGLTRADFPQIAKNARALKALSEDAEWAKPKLAALTRYGWFSLQFQDLTDEIAAKADAKNLDGATLGYVQLAANCVRCHGHVRDAKK